MIKIRTFVVVCLGLLIVSCEEILLEQDISDEKVEIIAPAGNVVLESSDVIFNWTALEGASIYQLQIASPDFTTPQQLIADTIVEDTYYFQELTENNYEWRVSAINSGYRTSFVSAQFKVQISEDFSEQDLNLYSPSDNYLSNNKSLTLNWGVVEDAAIYRIQVLHEDMVLQEKTTGQTHLQVELPEGESTWRVRAENDFENTFYSERNVFVDATKPHTPQLTNPKDKEKLTSTAVTFDWSRSESSGAEEIDSIFIFNDIGLSQLVEKERVTTSHNEILQPNETYYWMMRSYDAAGNASEQSSVFSFSIEF